MLRQFSLVLGAVIFASIADAQPLPSGAVVDDVKCAGDRTQSYALYLPSQYTPDRQWNLLIAFHPAARGAIFATAGTDDFNYLEMRLLDRKLKSPHRLAIFNGGHTLPPDAVALDAIEWMELQAMKSNRRPRSDQLIDRLLADRRALMASASSSVETVHLLEDFVADFTGLRDTSMESRRLKELSQQGDVKKALSRERGGL
jgi:hypothetical protein